MKTYNIVFQGEVGSSGYEDFIINVGTYASKSPPTQEQMEQIAHKKLSKYINIYGELVGYLEVFEIGNISQFEQIDNDLDPLSLSFKVYSPNERK